MKGGDSSLVESDGARQRVRIPRTRAGSRKNGVPLPHEAPPPVPSGSERRANGQFAPGARTLQSQGGKLARRRDVLAKRLNLPDLTSDDRRRAGELQKALLRDYTRLSGGELSTDVALLTEQAVLRAVGSRVAFAAGDATVGSRLADGCRSDLLACRALCGNDSQSRKRGGGPPAFEVDEEELDRRVERLMSASDSPTGATDATGAEDHTTGTAGEEQENDE